MLVRCPPLAVLFTQQLLAAGLRPHFVDRLPEAECAVGDRELALGRGADDDQDALRGVLSLACTWMSSAQNWTGAHREAADENRAVPVNRGRGSSALSQVWHAMVSIVRVLALI